MRIRIRLEGKAETGASCFISDNGINDKLSVGASNCNQSEFEAYKSAKLYASPSNGSQWHEAIQILEKAGFDVFKK